MRYSILIFSLAVLSCQRPESLPNDYPMIDKSTVLADSAYSPPAPKSHYSFVVFVTEEPLIMEHDFIRRGMKRYITEIQTINDTITEDYKYRELDLAETNLREAELSITEGKFRNLADVYKINPTAAQVDVVSRDIFVFDTYKDASIKRHQIMESDSITND